MATVKKPIAKASNAKKPAIVASKSVASSSSKAVKAKPASGLKKTAEVKSAGPVKKSDAVKGTVAKALLATSSKATAAKKAVPAKAAVSAKSSPSSKSEKPLAKATTTKTAAPAKANNAKPSAVNSESGKKNSPSVAPVKEVKKAEKKEAAPVVVKDQAPKKETKAQIREAQKRAASALQRVQAKVAASIPKPQPKPAPMPTVMPAKEDRKAGVVVAHRRLENKPKPVEDAGLTMLTYQPEYTRSILGGDEKESGPTYRYSDEELSEFRQLIQGRLDTARKELAYQQGLITHRDATGTEDTENRYMNMEDGSGAMEREQLAQLASRQIQFINHLEKAMIRIENKTYGICRVTGKLIDKARLRAVPHATLSIEAKNMINKK